QGVIVWTASMAGGSVSCLISGHNLQRVWMYNIGTGVLTKILDDCPFMPVQPRIYGEAVVIPGYKSDDLGRLYNRTSSTTLSLPLKQDCAVSSAQSGYYPDRNKLINMYGLNLATGLVFDRSGGVCTTPGPLRGLFDYSIPGMVERRLYSPVVPVADEDSLYLQRPGLYQNTATYGRRPDYTSGFRSRIAVQNVNDGSYQLHVVSTIPDRAEFSIERDASLLDSTVEPTESAIIYDTAYRYESDTADVWLSPGTYRVHATCDDLFGVQGEGEVVWTVASNCGDGSVQPGEECDGSDWGDRIDVLMGCTAFDDFTSGTLGCYPPATGAGLDCHFNTTGCTKDVPVPATCGDGIIDIGEDCDGANWGPNVDGCWWFDSFTGGTLSCIPSGRPGQCHFNTTLCSLGTFNTPMKCGDVDYTDSEGHLLDTIACNDTLYTGYVYPCPTSTSCLYGDEVNPASPDFKCLADGQVWTNVAGERIKCNGQVLGLPRNVWCPERFAYNPVGNKCEFSGAVCDAGRIYDPPIASWEAQCSVPIGQYKSRGVFDECLTPAGVPKDVACCMDFTVSDYADAFRKYGFLSTTSVTVI
ncbi:MAG: hypothetical protein ABIH41_05710, partial [Nanoarchaeota archaeon]